MSFLRKLLFASFINLLVATFAIQVCFAQENQNQVIADVNGVQLTQADLAKLEDLQTSAEILDSAYNYYYSQRKALDVVIDKRLLAEEAKRQNVTLEQLLASVGQNVAEPSEQEMHTIYEFSGSTEPFEAMREKISTQLRQVRQQKAQMEFMENLRAKARITVRLAPPVVEVALGDAPVRGAKNAAVTLIEFADYECPYCQRTHSALKQLQKEFGDQLAFAYKDFPLPNHPNARKAAEASRCAREQGKYWEYHDLLYETKKYTAEDLKQLVLGHMFSEGRGVGKDNILAYMWFRLAELCGAETSDYGKNGRKKVAATLHPEQISEAERRASEWVRKRQATADPASKPMIKVTSYVPQPRQPRRSAVAAASVSGLRVPESDAGCVGAAD